MEHTYTETHTLELSDAEYRTLRDVVAHHESQSGGACTPAWASILEGLGIEPEVIQSADDPIPHWSGGEPAKIGDVIKLTRIPDFELRFWKHVKSQEEVERLTHDEHTVIGLDELSDQAIIRGIGGGMQYVPHKWYTIIKRASDPDDGRVVFRIRQAKVGDTVRASSDGGGTVQYVVSSVTQEYAEGTIPSNGMLARFRHNDYTVIDSPEWAHEGDTIMLDYNYDILFRDTPYKVAWSTGHHAIVHAHIANIGVSHGMYRVVKRASQPPLTHRCDSCGDINPRQVVEHCRKCDEGTYEPVRASGGVCEVKQPKPSTAELVAMLAKRDGVKSISASMDERAFAKVYEPNVDGETEQPKIRMDGPATILVVPGGDA